MNDWYLTIKKLSDAVPSTAASAFWTGIVVLKKSGLPVGSPVRLLSFRRIEVQQIQSGGWNFGIVVGALLVVRRVPLRPEHTEVDGIRLRAGTGGVTCVRLGNRKSPETGGQPGRAQV